MNRGIVLAGGNATRLPNKPLLPLHNGKPAITSGIDLLLRSGITTVDIVIAPNSPIPDILRKYYELNFRFIEQKDALGVPLAISQILPFDFQTWDKFVVVFCDNVYGKDYLIQTNDERRGHTIMKLDDGIKAKSLSRYINGLWTQGNFGPSTSCLAGWMILNLKMLSAAHHYSNTIDFLNGTKAKPIKIEDPDWWDIGTLETYTDYWRHYESKKVDNNS